MSNSETVCKCIATLMIPASTVQMLSGTSIVYSAILTVIYLKKKLYKHHFLGITLILLGVFLVGLACFLDHKHPEDPVEEDTDELVFGIILLQVGILFGAIGFIIEEKFMSNQKDLDPMLVVGCEGASASIMWVVLLTAFYYLPCNSKTFCSDGKLENTPGAWEDYAANSTLIYQSIAIVLIIPCSSYCGVTTTKKGSAS